jgi:hypothetical protein
MGRAKGKASEQAAAALNVSPASVERAPGGGRMKTDPQAHDKAKAGTLPRAKAPKVKHLEKSNATRPSSRTAVNGLSPDALREIAAPEGAEALTALAIGVDAAVEAGQSRHAILSTVSLATTSNSSPGRPPARPRTSPPQSSPGSPSRLE